MLKKSIPIVCALAIGYGGNLTAEVIQYATTSPENQKLIDTLNQKNLPYSITFLTLDEFNQANIESFKQQGGLALVDLSNTINSADTLANYFGTGISTKMALVYVTPGFSGVKSNKIAPITENADDKKIDQILLLAAHLTGSNTQQYSTQSRQKRSLSQSDPGILAYNDYIVLEGDGQVFDIAVEVFHNTRDHIKIARLVTQGVGYTRQFYRAKTNNGDGFTKGFAKYQLKFPINYNFSFEPISGGSPIRVTEFSPDNPAQGVTMHASTDISFSIKASANSDGPSGDAGFGISWNKRTSWNTQDYTTRAFINPSNTRKVSWDTNLHVVRSYKWSDYGKWLGIYHYTSCSDDNLVYENEWPKPATGFSPKYQYVVRLDNTDPNSASFNGITTIKANSKFTIADEKFLRDWCSWHGDGSKRINKEANVNIHINWGDNRLTP
ncbi:hypothetical protein [Spartinivicinus ruber]|uniref:hypothetical protein n=1 Tax=Spartinivicinus ruber TaxID=2683272 RepID=UPI0013CFDF36|nr:hypothetical protein [Spartinivicinus ruber]